jgi:uncharacterized protein YdhG (YjbR/CyaY superfamily)
MQIMTTMKFKSIDECLESVSDDKRTELQRLQKIIGAAVPGVEECISYNMPAFSLDGKAFIWFGAGAITVQYTGYMKPARASSANTTQTQAAKALFAFSPPDLYPLPSYGS